MNNKEHNSVSPQASKNDKVFRLKIKGIIQFQSSSTGTAYKALSATAKIAPRTPTTNHVKSVFIVVTPVVVFLIFGVQC